MRGADEKLCEKCAEGSMLTAVSQINCSMQAAWGTACGEDCDSVLARGARNSPLKSEGLVFETSLIGLYR